ncbi:MAG: SDR family oxidoreductase [Myxococcales bacterium]|nr:SDR family oxidoreductase [Myxococcales bacterium]MCB9643874.1 SDR family oxidoreductase [Myxococcales bacterium]
MQNDFRGKAVLITGGTKGIGLAIGLAFGRLGAQTYLTHRWGSADESEILARFEALGAPAPQIIEADVVNDDDLKSLIKIIQEKHERIEVFISNVCVVQPANGIESYKKRSLLKSLEYSAWPFVNYTMQIKKAFGHYPRYVVGISSDGPDHYFSHYDYVAASKAVMETFCRYMASRLHKQDVRFNVVRTRSVPTDAIREIFGNDYVDFVSKYGGEEYFMQPEEVADAVLAVCSGMLDALNGQIIQVDKGSSFADTMLRLMEKREELGL